HKNPYQCRAWPPALQAPPGRCLRPGTPAHQRPRTSSVVAWVWYWSPDDIRANPDSDKYPEAPHTMHQMTLQILIFLSGFVIGILLLVKGADIFVSGGSGLAARYQVSPALIGFTIIAFGTSLPELVVNLEAAAAGTPEIALGNIIGSTIANIALVL